PSAGRKCGGGVVPLSIDRGKHHGVSSQRLMVEEDGPPDGDRSGGAATAGRPADEGDRQEQRGKKAAHKTLLPGSTRRASEAAPRSLAAARLERALGVFSRRGPERWFSLFAVDVEHDGAIRRHRLAKRGAGRVPTLRRDA